MTDTSKTMFYRAFGRPIATGEYENKFFNGSRTPKSMPLEIHYFADQWFNQQFKVKARSSCVFVAKNKTDVEQYKTGTESVIKHIYFPENALYIYSVAVKDLVISIRELQEKLEKTNLSIEEVEKLLFESDYQITQDPSSIVEDAGEIMVFSTSYFIV